MGISLKDFASFAEGAIERDRELTKEDFEIRNANLAANRDMLIKQKEAKYKKELDNYYEEKKKFDEIEKMNTAYKNKEIDKGTYAAFALSSTIPNFNLLPKDKQTELIDNFDGETINYNLKGNVDEINKNAAIEQTAINDSTAAAIKAAKGDSFLINKILRKKGIDDKKLLSDVQSQIEAAELVELTEKSTDNSGLEVKMSGSQEDKGAKWWKNFKKKQPDWIKQYNNLDKEIKYGSATQNNNFLNFMKTSEILGTNTEANFTLKNNDTTIEGLTPAAQAILDTYKNIYDEVRKSFSAQELAAQGVDITELRDFMTTEAINKKVQNIMSDRYFIIETGKGAFDREKRMDFLAVVPLSVMNEANQIVVTGQGVPQDGGKGLMEFSNEQIKMLYDKFLKIEGPKLENKYSKNKTFNSYNAIQSSIETEGVFKDKFLSFISDELRLSTTKDDPNTPENEAILNSPKVKADEKLLTEMSSSGDSVIKLNEEGKVVPQDKGKFGTPETRITIDPNNKGFIQGGKFFSWEEIEKTNQVNKLPNILKLRYETWKSTQ